LLALGLVGAGVLAQEPAPEVHRVVVDDFRVASPALRSTTVVWDLDKDHDQYLSEAEVAVPLNRVQRSVDNARLRYYMAGRDDENSLRLATTAPRGLRHRTLARLSSANQELDATGAFELSLVDEAFHRLFADLPPAQRAALLEADVEGNNDGMVTVAEFYAHNRRLLFKKTRFETDFGEDAYLAVLRLLGAL
jgi:DNA-directed RNA polymerase specialized sigma24 family protein